MKKKIISTKMKVFMSILLISSITCFVSATVVLSNSGFSLANYFNWNNFNLGFFIDDHYGYSKSTASAISIDNIENISIDFSSIDADVSTYDGSELMITAYYRRNNHIFIEDLLSIVNDNNNLELSFNSNNNFNNLNIKISIPRAYYNDIALNGTTGDISLNNSNFKNLTAKFNYGDIYISNSTLDNINIDVINGEINSNKLTCNNISINSSYGDIYLKNSDIASNTINNKSGDVYCHFTNTPTSLNIENINGEVELSLPKASEFTISFETRFGELDHNITKITEMIEKSTDTSKVYTLTKGSISNIYNVKSTNGDLNIKVY